MSGTERTVGRLVEVWRYPVKAMAGQRLERAEISWQGIAGDRRWAFVQTDLARSNFPWLTIRDRSELVRYRPALAEPDRPNDSDTVVHTPGGERFDVADPALAASLGTDVRVIKQARGTFDSSPLSLISAQSVAALADAVGRDLDVRRFRPNLFVETTGPDAAAFAEDAWIGSTLRIGPTLRVRVDRVNERCVVTTVDPDTAQRDHRVLKTLADRRENRIGVYASTVTPGPVVPGDEIVLEGPA